MCYANYFAMQSITRGHARSVAIAALAGVFYVINWEIYLALSHKDFMAEYSQAMLEQARARYEDAVRGEQAAVGVLLNEWSTDKARLDQLTAELVPAARNRTEAALAAYRAGKGDLAAVLAARRDEVDARMQLLSLEMEVARDWARLNYLVPDPALASRQDAR